MVTLKAKSMTGEIIRIKNIENNKYSTKVFRSFQKSVSKKYGATVAVEIIRK